MKFGVLIKLEKRTLKDSLDDGMIILPKKFMNILKKAQQTKFYSSTSDINTK